MGTTLTGALLTLALGAASNGGDIKLGETREYGDWVTGCDNLLSCEAVALLRPEEFGEYSLMVKRNRALAPGKASAPITISLGLGNISTDRYRVIVDGRTIETGTIQNTAGQAVIRSKDAERLAKAIAFGNRMQLQDDSGQTLATFSLKGSAASLRYMDVRLGLSGTRQAIVAKGRRSPRKKEVQPTVIKAQKLDAVGAAPETADIIRLIDNSPCKADRFGVKEDRTYPLGISGNTERALVLLACGSGAYNFTSAVYLAKRSGEGPWSFEAAPFDLKPRSFDDGGNLPLMVNASWDTETQSLSSYAKGRGLGDCGSSASYVWDGESFRLVEARSMPACRGALDWITVWRANVVFKG